jgi:hypothetical protein
MADIARDEWTLDAQRLEIQEEQMLDASQAAEEEQDVAEDDEEDNDIDFIPPSVRQGDLFHSLSFDYFSNIPKSDEDFVMGIDEAGRGPVLG